jgi:hypothetical protein
LDWSFSRGLVIFAQTESSQSCCHIPTPRIGEWNVHGCI